MAVYLGSAGFVEIRRDANQQALTTRLDPADVNTDKRRFSVDFAAESLISGDQVEIRTADGSDLVLVDGHDGFPDWRGFIHVDDAGGIRLYNNFDLAITGDKSSALALETPSSAKDVLIKTTNIDYRCLASIKDYELTTSRDQVDTTVLGQEYKNQYEAGLISGQGSLNCFWKHEAGMCDQVSSNSEFPVYLAKLVLRLQQGSDFLGRFYIYWGGVQEASVWYEAQCIITNVAVTVAPTELVETSVQFVTSGPVTLKTGFPDFVYLTQENNDLILQEDGTSGILLQDPT